MNSFFINNRLSIFLALLLSSVSVFSQDAKKDLAAITEVYLGDNAVWIDLEYSKYVNKVKGNPLEEFSGVACYLKNSSYQMADSVESIITNNYSIVVDHKYKTILKSKLNVIEAQEIKKRSSSLDFSAFLESFKVLDYKKINRDSALYIFQSKLGEPQEITMIFNPRNYKIHEVQMKFLSKQDVSSDKTTYFGYPIVRVVYRTHKKVKKKKEFFTDKRFLIKKGDKEIATKKYSSYKVVAN